MIFVDSNIPMYLVGVDHPHKAGAEQSLSLLAARGARLASSAEVFQEILHRYSATRRHELIAPAFRVLQRLADEVFPIEVADVLAAQEWVGLSMGLSARDALHVAVMRRHQITEILTFDTGFDAVPGIQRLPA